MAKLINEETGLEVKEGDKVTTFRDEIGTLVSFAEPHKPSSSGKVYVQFDGLDYRREFYPSVIGCKIVDHQFS